MKHVRITIVASDPSDVRTWGEVKAVDIAGRPTIAHAVAMHGTGGDTFAASAGHYSYHFRVSAKTRLTLSTEIDGVSVGPPEEIDATVLTSGHRFGFTVTP